MSRIDYCNTVLVGVYDIRISCMQDVWPDRSTLIHVVSSRNSRAVQRNNLQIDMLLLCQLANGVFRTADCRWFVGSATTRSTACARRCCSSIREAEVAWWCWYHRCRRRSWVAPIASICCAPGPSSPSTLNDSLNSMPFSPEVTCSTRHIIRFCRRYSHALATCHHYCSAAELQMLRPSAENSVWGL